jgi:nucleoside-diphosphate-sugar epimerase
VNNPKKILIAGCGYTGQALSRYASKRGDLVWGLRRNREKENQLREAGAQPLFVDLLDTSELAMLPDVDYVVCVQAPRNHQAGYKTTYVKATRNLVSAFRGRAIKKFLWVSSTSVYGDCKDGWVEADTLPNPESNNSKYLLESERIVLKSSFPSVILRLGGIYGPERNRMHLIEQGIVSANDPGFMNHIHVEDVARLIYFLLESGAPGEIYLGVDDAPVLRCEFYGWLIHEAHIRVAELRSKRELRQTTSKRCSNAKIKSLGFKLKYPTFREGFREIIKSKLEIANKES